MSKSAEKRQVEALVIHEWFASIGGSENVANAIRASFDGSDLLCLWQDPGVEIPGTGKVIESPIGRTPLRGRKVLALPFMPFVWRFTKARRHPAEVAIVSTHLFAHHVALPKRMLKLLYVHTPARYIWEPSLDARGDSLLARLISSALKPLDRLRASEAAEIAANSYFVQQRIKKAWGRESEVIYPPVDVEEIRAVDDWYKKLDKFEKSIVEELPEKFLLGASRFIPYKRLDLVIRAGELTGLPVVLAGAGNEEGNLREQAHKASVAVRFVGSPSDALLRTLYQRAAVYVFPPVEDFGIMPVECMAAGTPVVSNRRGGAGESVVDGVTGAHFEPDDDLSLLQAIELALTLDRSKISETTLRFSRARFDSEIQNWTWGALERQSQEGGH